jgi:hypothetical protein
LYASMNAFTPFPTTWGPPSLNYFTPAPLSSHSNTIEAPLTAGYGEGSYLTAYPIPSSYRRSVFSSSPEDSSPLRHYAGVC